MNRRQSVERLVALMVKVWGPFIPASPDPKRIFVLRNNDIGDLLAVTPLFEALKRGFPEAELSVGVGAWNLSVLENNPWVDHVLNISAPWHNQVTGRCSNSIGGFLRSLWYIATSPEVRKIRADVGVDVLGSPEGALLLARAGIPFRIGTRGYAYDGGTFQQSCPYDAESHVAAGALKLAGLLGIENWPEARPQIFLTTREVETAKARWEPFMGRRLVVTPGGGYEAKRWPRERFQSVIQSLQQAGGVSGMILGSASERELGESVTEGSPDFQNGCGQFSLRESMALVEQADAVLCNSSMFLHVAAAFRKPCVTVLGEIYKDVIQHQKQWGYAEPSVMLGKRFREDSLPGVEEVVVALKERMGL